MVLALLLLEGLSALVERLLGQPALGLGDAKLAALGGAWLGPGGIAAAMALAVVSGALVGSTARFSGPLGPRELFPFCSFIAIEHVAGLVDRSAVVVEHLVDAVGRLIPQRLTPGRLLMV